MDSTVAGIARALNNDVDALGLVSQNVANMQTPGYLGRQLTRNFATGLPAVTALNLGKGAIKHTGQPLDLALQGNAFFAVDVDGQTLLTRDGRFHINGKGQLASVGGALVLGDAGPITLSGSAVQILPDGRVEDHGHVVDRLRMVAVADPQKLEATGSGLYRYAGDTSVATGAIQIGALEQSNVDPGTEMVRLIEITRHVQSLQHAMQAYDEALQTGINHLGDTD